MRTAPDDECSLDSDGRTIVEALGGTWQARGALCRCPAHEDRTPSLSVRPGHQRLLFHCFAGCEPARIIRSLRELRLLSASGRQDAGTDLPPPAHKSLSPLAARIWSEARAAGGSSAERYLEARGIDLRSSELRFHPRTPIGRAPLTSFRPAMIAAVRDESGLVGVHRTFLGTAQNHPEVAVTAKLALGCLAGGAVRLAPFPDDILGLAEGIETALSVSQLFRVPCWATLGTERFRHVVVPASVRRVILYLDSDRGGRRAERLARGFYAHASFSIEAIYPKNQGEDWNDVLRTILGITPHSVGEESKAVA